MDCHSDSSDYIYFTLVLADRHPALDSNGEKTLYYVKPSWRVIYRETLRKALFNDPQP